MSKLLKFPENSHIREINKQAAVEKREALAEKRRNPLDLNNRLNYSFDGYDMRFYRFRLSDLSNGPNKREAKKLGLTLTVEGRKRTYRDVSGAIVAIYSYDTCIYTRIYDDAEGIWRDVLNLTPYSHTTTKHQGKLFRTLYGIGLWEFKGGYTVSHTGEWPDVDYTYGPLPLASRQAIELASVDTETSAEELSDIAKLAIRPLVKAAAE